MQQDDSQQNAELRQAFLRHLPKRLLGVCKRGLRLCQQGWDINALSLLFGEVQTLAGACGRYGLLELSEHLFSLEGHLAPFVERVAVPDNGQSHKIELALLGLEPLIAQHETISRQAARPAAAIAVNVFATEQNGFPLWVVPPPEYWRRLESIPKTGVTSDRVPNAPPRPAAAAVQSPIARAPVANEVRPEAPPRLPEPNKPAAPVIQDARSKSATANGQRKVFHLSDGNPLACELDQKLEGAGYELTILDSVDELTEVLATFAPHLVVVDAPFLVELDRIGASVKLARAKLTHRLALLAFSASSELSVRLRSMRAGADAFIALPAQSADVMARVAELLDTDTSDPFRVLIVEDDRSQAIFAESILRKAGIETRAVTDPLAALDQLEEFLPDLILMDLYMPNCDGMELTSIIREREAFVSTPIVFLSGEQDQEKHFEALNAGGDDFLSKPIRPKHLISAVTNRVRRARQLARRSRAHNPRDAVSGLYDRAHVLDQLNALLTRDHSEQQAGGLVYVEVDEAGKIRERIGLTAFEALLIQVGAFIASHLDTKDLAARYGDVSFVLLSASKDEAALKAFAGELRQLTAREVFEHDGKTENIGLSFGLVAFAAGLRDAGAMVNAAERAMTEARASGGSHIAAYQPMRARVARNEHQALADQIRVALKADGFQLLFQPIVSLQGADDEQFQCLLRLRGDGGRMYTAAEILPIAEREGLIGDVDRWVLSRCMLVLSERLKKQRPVRLFVSQAIEAVRDAQRIPWIAQMLETRRLPGHHLALEFRISDAIAHLRDLAVFATAAKQHGVMLAISGFEANKIAFQLLEHLPADFIKVAARYVGEALATSITREELRQIVDHAHERGLRVIAPRIEDAQSAAVLWNAGVDFIQGDFVQQAGQDLSYDFRASAI
jgi:diguanylate cyclase (GGDEF)-like protein